MSEQSGGRPRILVLGNEKGGSGKSTTAMHVLTGLAKQGHRIAAIDLDSRQRSLSRYLENRRTYCDQHGLDLVQPPFTVIGRSDGETVKEAKRDERAWFTQALESYAGDFDTILIDCPGSDTYLARYAHAHADTLITPVNDSFVDLDLFARIDAETQAIQGPSLYAEMVWEARKWRAVADGGQIDWVVLRNRMPVHMSRNKARVQKALDLLSKRVGFRHIPGLAERTIFRELFLMGLTLMDLDHARLKGLRSKMNMSHVTARNEVRKVIEALSTGTAATQGTGTRVGETVDMPSEEENDASLTPAE